MSWVKPEEALEKFQSKLTYFEINKEIKDFPAIYYVGENSTGKNFEYDANQKNNGFDNPDGTYKVVLHDHIGYRFEIIKILGTGVSGQVLECYDHRFRRSVAIKVFSNTVDYTDNALQEIQILQQLQKSAEKKGYQNIIQMYENFVFREHTCIVFEVLAMNLYELLVKNNYKGFSLRLIRKFARQLLETLELLKKNKIIHCDLKPENILLKEKGKSGIKLSDFSSACYQDYQMYLYIQSRSYRAPEVIFGASYSYPIDMWSFGCILAELYTGYSLFLGSDEDDQVGCIMEVIGMPPENFLKVSDKRYNFVSSKGFPRYCTITQPDGSVTWTDGKNAEGIIRGKPGTRKLAAALNNCQDREFIDLIAQCLEWDPAKRITPSKALRHRFLNQNDQIDNPKHRENLQRSATLNSKAAAYRQIQLQKQKEEEERQRQILKQQEQLQYFKAGNLRPVNKSSSKTTSSSKKQSSSSQLPSKSKTFVR